MNLRLPRLVTEGERGPDQLKRFEAVLWMRAKVSLIGSEFILLRGG
jgi:hypothetical protein